MKISYLHEHGAALAVLVYVGLVALVGDGEGGLVDGLVALLAGVGLVLVLPLAVLQPGVDLERSVLVLLVDVGIRGAELLCSLVSPPESDHHADGEEDHADTAERDSENQIDFGVRIIVIIFLPLYLLRIRFSRHLLLPLLLPLRVCSRPGSPAVSYLRERPSSIVVECPDLKKLS